MEIAERLICRIILGEVPAWPRAGERAQASRFIELLRLHGVTTLVARGLSGGAARESWPAEILDFCREQSLAQAVAEMAGRAEIARVLLALANAGIKALLLKGGSLAYSHYDNPVLRPRGDTDLLIPRHARRLAEEVLRRLGYVPSLQMSGEFISYQANWACRDRLGVIHDLDMHWRVNNSQVLANLLDYGELAARAALVPELGANAYALVPVHALLFACMHLAGHRNAPLYLDGIAYPAGARQGFKTTISLGGQNLQDVTHIRLSGSGIRKPVLGKSSSFCRYSMQREPSNATESNGSRSKFSKRVP